MPTRRRTSTPRSAATQRQQSTLSFHGKHEKNNKVTKTFSAHSAKGSKKDPALLEDLVQTDLPAEHRSDLEEESTAAAKAIEQQTKAEVEPTETQIESEESGGETSHTEDVLGTRGRDSDVGAVGGGAGWLGDEEQEARRISPVQVKNYWRAKEAERKAPRVHQQHLTIHEKILREWDMSNQYGPCIGIARLKRWKRANRLGLKPPIEVLAVLLREMDDGETASQRAHVDELMSSRFIET